MRPLTSNDIESELSYVYLHAVASKVGASCNITNRSLDGNGIDAAITGWAPSLMVATYKKLRFTFN
jgi:hypothetical protein